MKKIAVASIAAPDIAPRLIPAVALGLKLGEEAGDVGSEILDVEPGVADCEEILPSVPVGVESMRSLEARADAYGGSNSDKSLACQKIRTGSAIMVPYERTVVLKLASQLVLVSLNM